jgi:hypothetical protein
VQIVESIAIAVHAAEHDQPMTGVGLAVASLQQRHRVARARCGVPSLGVRLFPRRRPGARRLSRLEVQRVQRVGAFLRSGGPTTATTTLRLTPGLQPDENRVVRIGRKVVHPALDMAHQFIFSSFSSSGSVCVCVCVCVCVSVSLSWASFTVKCQIRTAVMCSHAQSIRAGAELDDD